MKNSFKHRRAAPGNANTTLKPVALRTGAKRPSLPYSSTSISPAAIKVI